MGDNVVATRGEVSAAINKRISEYLQQEDVASTRRLKQYAMITERINSEFGVSLKVSAIRCRVHHIINPEALCYKRESRRKRRQEISARVDGTSPEDLDWLASESWQYAMMAISQIERIKLDDKWMPRAVEAIKSRLDNIHNQVGV